MHQLTRRLISTFATSFLIGLAGGALDESAVGQSKPQADLARSIDLNSRTQRLLEENPRLRVAMNHGVGRVYGAFTQRGPDAHTTADAFIADAMPSMGIDPADLSPYASFLEQGNSIGLMHDRVTGQPKFTAVYYTQVRDGIEVFRTRLTLVMRNQPDHPLVLAAIDLREMGKFHVEAGVAQRIDPAPAFVEAMLKFGPALQFGEWSPVIWAGVEEMVVEPALAIEFIAEGGAPANGDYQKMLIVADAFTGEILFEESLVHRVDVAGNVSGMSTVGNAADVCNDEVLMGMPYARVTVGGTPTYADVNGDFVIPNGGSSPVTVDSAVRGQFFVVNNTTTPGGGNTTLSQTVDPPGPANFIYNQANDNEYKRAEVNAYIQANVVRDFALAQNPDYPTIGTQTEFPVNVNINTTCNAFYNGTSINFYRSGGGCTNTANATVVHHEYGHHLVATGGSGQGAYGEGMSDCMSLLIADSPCLGNGFQACGTCLRNADNACQYQTSGCSSCGSQIHACGQLISGCVWSTRNELFATNPIDYLEILSQLTVNSILLHSGTAINPNITIDFLTLDDTDGNILNGTPHYNQIAAGFGAHNMPAPPLDVGISISPSGPAASFISSGLAGGPFNPPSKVYTIQNVEDNISLEYEITSNQPWLDISNATGTLAPGAMVEVTVSLNGNAAALPNGLYNATLAFTNLTNGWGNTTKDASLEVGRIIYSSYDTPIAINSHTTINSLLDVKDHYCIADVDVAVNISHTYIGDLVVEAIAPDGTVVRLHNRTGGSADDIVKTYDDCTTAPDGPGVLANFNGAGVNGQWKLKVSDHASGDIGTLNSWQLRVIPAGALCPPEASDIAIAIPAIDPAPIALAATSPNGLPITYVILSLPVHGLLSDPNGGAITSTPYSLINHGNTVVYDPIGVYVGPDAFTYKAYDGQDSLPADVDIVVGGPQVVYVFNFDANPGWTTTGNWAFGQPTGQGTSGRLDPTFGHTGVNVYGYNLNGHYTNNMPEYTLTSNPIDCSKLYGTQVKFWRWLGVERAQYDHARFQVSSNGTTWTTVWENPVPAPSINESAWSQHAYDISSIADGHATVFLRWTMGTTDSSVTYQGWNIDDVEIWGILPIPKECPGDINSSGSVDVDDLLAVINAWGACPGCPADVNGDNVVNVDDLLAVINAWGVCK